MRNVLMATMLIACGPTSGAQSDAGGGDSGAGGGSDVTAACKIHKRTVTATDGSKTEERVYFAYWPDVHPGDRWAIEACDYAVTPTSGPACPTAHTCVDSGDPIPTSTPCQWITSATFYSGNLFFNCGSGETTRDSGGAITSIGDGYYQRVTLHR